MAAPGQPDKPPRGAVVRGAILGALLVALLAILITELIREPGHPAIFLAIGLFGAICGAYAAGVIRYEDEHDPSLHPVSAPQPPAAEEPAAEPAQSPARQLWGRYRGALPRLPLAPWV